jgi:hypothetical protein
MQREVSFREEVAKLPADEREKRIELHKRQLAMLKAAHGNAPGHREQLKEVWDEGDGMRDMPFDPRVFFRLHDTTGDAFLDLKELEALFYREAKELHTTCVCRERQQSTATVGWQRLTSDTFRFPPSPPLRQRTFLPICLFSFSDEGDVDEIALREEMARMRDTVMAEADTDKDGLVSELEFLQLTKRPDFDENAAWDPLFVSVRE